MILPAFVTLLSHAFAASCGWSMTPQDSYSCVYVQQGGFSGLSSTVLLKGLGPMRTWYLVFSKACHGVEPTLGAVFLFAES